MLNISSNRRASAWNKLWAAAPEVPGKMLPAKTALGALAAIALLAGCGGGGSAPPMPPAAMAPAITTQPVSQNVVAGAPATFSVAASGTAPITYQWKRDGNAIAGATAASYTLPTAQRSDTASKWTVTVSNAAGSVNSDGAILTVNQVMTLVAGAPGGAGTALGVGGRLDRPLGVALDAGGNLYVATRNSIRRVGLDGKVSAVPGSSSVNPSGIRGITVGADGTVYAVEQDWIKKIMPSGVGYILAGNGTSDVPGKDGPAQVARFYQPDSLVVDAQGTLYVADTGYGKIRTVLPDGTTSTLAGNPGMLRVDDGVGADAHFAAPRGIARDGAGNLYVGDQNTIRKVTPAGVVTTIAGVAGQSGSADGGPGVGRLGNPTSLVVDKAGNILIADSANFTIRKLTPAGVLSTITSVIGQGDDSGNLTPVDLNYLAQGLGFMAIDSADNVFFADINNNVVRKMTPAGVISTAAGARSHAGNVDGTGAAARFDQVGSMSTDAAGNVYIAANKTIRKVTPDGVTTSLTTQANPDAAVLADYYPAAIGIDGSVYGFDGGAVFKADANGARTKLAGHSGPDAVDGIGTAAVFSLPGPLTVDAAGNVYLIDRARPYCCVHGIPSSGGWQSVRKISSSGVVSTIAWTTGRFEPDSPFLDLAAIEVDQKGNVYVISHNLVIKITPDGTRTTLAGTETYSPYTVHGVGLSKPTSLALDRNGNLYVADSGAFKVYKITADGIITTVAGRTGESGAVAGVLPASLGPVTAMTVDAKGALYLMMENALFKIEQ